MKRLSYIIPFILSMIFLSSHIIFSQSGWIEYNTGAPYLGIMSVADTNTIYARMTGMLFKKSTNGGTNWFDVYGGDSRGWYYTFVNENTGWSFETDSYIRKTTDGGLNWESQGVPGVHIFYSNYGFFLNENTGWALANSIDTGDHHYILKTTNSGENWSIVYDDKNVVTHEKIQFINPMTGWCISGTKFLKSTNGGLNWTRYFPSSYGYNSISFIDAMTGWLSDTNGVLQKTTNGGANWTLLVNSGFKKISEITFLNANTGYAIGHRRILKTTDGGSNWSLQFKGYNAYFYSIKFINDNTGYACCNGSNILKTTNAGNWLVGVNTISSIPGGFMLEQNYPNPFNPITRINFSIPFAENVKVSVYDVLGNEIEVVVDDNFQPGTYSVDFNAEKYSSGVYFYRLVSGNFTASKKMIIAK